MPLDRRRLRRIVLFWVTRVTGVLMLLAAVYLMVAARPESTSRPILPLLATGTLAVALLLAAHFLQPRPVADEAAATKMTGADLPVD